MKTIVIRNAEIENQPMVLLEFSFDPILIEQIKKISGSKWIPSLRTWSIPYSNQLINTLYQTFNGKAWLDYSGFKKITLPVSKPVNFIELSETTLLEIDKFRDWIRNRRYSESTVKNYIKSLSLFLRFMGNKGPETITNEDLESFHKEYILARKYSASFQSLVINAVKLYFSNRLHRKLDTSKIEKPKQPRLLPHVLCKEDVKANLQAHQNVKHRAKLSLIYACGLRRGELLSLKLHDIDSKRGLLRVNQSKGKKDRMVPISEKMLDLLKEYYRYEKPSIYLFEGTSLGKTYNPTSLQEVLKSAVKKAGITKQVPLHWLRHSYATHLLENCTDLRYIQELLGHNSRKQLKYILM